MNKIIRLIDRTRTVADWKCPRARYWGYEYQGRGIVKNGNSLELFLGIAVHDALASIAKLTLNEKEVDIDALSNALFKQVFEELNKPSDSVLSKDVEEFALEQATLCEGMIRGFYAHVWPRLMNEYKIVCTEEEMEYALDEAGEFIFMTKPDLIVENQEGELIYLEYKTTSSKKENWVNSWDTAVQLHSSVKATERSLGKAVSHVQIVGLYKGYESYGKQSSPFCYAYKKSGNPPFTQDQISYEYKAGLRRIPVWELPGGVKKWVAEMPENVLANQYPMTLPIPVNEDLINRFFAQRLERENEIWAGVESLKELPEYAIETLDQVFPQRFDQCVPSFGWSCQYKKLCHGYVEDPLTEGFVLREPHHEQERIQLGLSSLEDDGSEENVDATRKA